MLVLALFALFVYAGIRIALRSVDPFLRLLTATATMWVLGQAFINVGYVVGLLPVTGLQLPMISSVVAVDVPPAEISGSCRPVTGSRPTT